MTMRTLPALALCRYRFRLRHAAARAGAAGRRDRGGAELHFTLTPTLVADELKLWEKNGLRFNRRPQHDVEWEVCPDI
jgi:hypothetical protein